jgi:hypothetical protein
MAAYNRMNLHVTAGVGSPFRTFDAAGAASSHFYVSRAGDVEQFVDTELRAEADLEGNDATISVETEGGWPAAVAETEAWTEAQLDALAALFVWAVRTHGIAAQIATSSALGAPSRGLSWHRLGVDGAFPELPSPLAGRRQRGGGMRYSRATGKLCPGAGKIQQVPAVFARAQTLLAGAAPAVAVPASGTATAAAPAFPLPAGHCFGPKEGPVWQHSGFYDHREDLRRWQQQLSARGATLAVDGLYGPETNGVARTFQAEQGLVVDGLIGPLTWAAAWEAPGVR